MSDLNFNDKNLRLGVVNKDRLIPSATGKNIAIVGTNSLGTNSVFAVFLCLDSEAVCLNVGGHLNVLKLKDRFLRL